MGSNKSKVQPDNRRKLIVFPSDEQVGSSVGLMSPDFVTSRGKAVEQNEAQRVLWDLWIESWEGIGKIKSQEPTQLIIVNCGDSTDSIHHGTTELDSLQNSEQVAITASCLKEAMKVSKFDKKDGDLLYIVPGTEAHTQSAGENEELLGKMLDAVPVIEGKTDFDGKHIWEHLQIRCFGRLINISHHGGTIGKRTWLLDNEFRLALKSIYYDCLEREVEIPDYVIRGDKHNHINVSYKGAKKMITGVVLPCFQFKTYFAYQVAVDKTTSLGLFALIVEKDGTIKEHTNILTINDDMVLPVQELT